MKRKEIAVLACTFAALAATCVVASPLTPGDDIQSALDAAAVSASDRTVELGVGMFEVTSQLMVTGGVTLVGQGWDKTVIKYTGSESVDGRVVLLKDGSFLSHVTVTGGRQNKTTDGGGGVYVSDGGTVSWCCITNNYAKNHIGGGIGILGAAPVKIDHTIVAYNSAGLTQATAGGGIGIRAGSSGNGLNVEIDCCLVYSNTVASGSCGAGIGVTYKKYNDGSTDLSRVTTLVRHTTIVGNQATGTGKGGALYTTQNNTTLVNCILSGNTAPSDVGAAFIDDDVSSSVSEKTFNCLFDVDATPFGANPVAADPKFKDALHNDYHISRESKAFDAGMRQDGVHIDLEGRSRDNRPDIGCYELTPLGFIVRLR